MNSRLTYALILISLSFSSAVGEPPAVGEAGVVSNMNEPLRSYPGGPQIGQLGKNLSVLVLEQREDFVRVSLEGWVKHSALGRKVGKTESLPPVKPEQEVIELQGYEIKQISARETGDVARMVLTLRVRNISETPLKGWEGLLVVQGPRGNVLFRSGVSSEGETISSGGSGSVSFNWKTGEKEFEELSRYNVDELKVLLLKVKER